MKFLQELHPRFRHQTLRATLFWSHRSGAFPCPHFSLSDTSALPSHNSAETARRDRSQGCTWIEKGQGRVPSSTAIASQLTAGKWKCRSHLNPNGGAALSLSDRHWTETSASSRNVLFLNLHVWFGVLSSTAPKHVRSVTENETHYLPHEIPWWQSLGMELGFELLMRMFELLRRNPLIDFSCQPSFLTERNPYHEICCGKQDYLKTRSFLLPSFFNYAGPCTINMNVFSFFTRGFQPISTKF